MPLYPGSSSAVKGEEKHEKSSKGSKEGAGANNKPVVLIRHKSTLRIKNSKSKDLTFIEEIETSSLSDVKKELEFKFPKTNVSSDSSVGAGSTATTTGSASNQNQKTNCQHTSSLSSFSLPPVNKAADNQLDGSSQSIFSKSANFDEQQSNSSSSQLLVYRSLNNSDKKTTSTEHTSRLTKNDFKLGARSKSFYNFGSHKFELSIFKILIILSLTICF